MSFLKNLFEKRKDKKYGKGYKLGDSSSSSSSSNLPQNNIRENTIHNFQNQNDDAARRAGAAALARMENSKFFIKLFILSEIIHFLK
jgi:hypothetical protein